MRIGQGNVGEPDRLGLGPTPGTGDPGEPNAEIGSREMPNRRRFRGRTALPRPAPIASGC